MSAKAAIYLDANAGVSLAPSAQSALQEYLRGVSEGKFGHPASTHSHGQATRRLVFQARERVAQSLGFSSENLQFTSSGTDALHRAIRASLERAPSESDWILSSVEHSATHALKDWHLSRGGRVHEISVNSQGQLNLEELEACLSERTSLVSLLWVNNETGVIFPVERVAEICKKKAPQAHFLVDAAQAWGKIPAENSDGIGGHLQLVGADWVTFSGCKIGALSGVGVLWSSKRVKAILPPRSATENVPGVITLGAVAAERTNSVIQTWMSRSEALRNQFEKELLELIPGTRIHGSLTSRVANTSNFSLPISRPKDLVTRMDLMGFSLSAGSACRSGSGEPSFVLLAMGINREQALASLRLSFWSPEVFEKGMRNVHQALQKLVKESA